MPLARTLALAAAAAALLAGCAAQPIGTFDAPRLSAVGAEAQADLVFRPGTASLLPGEADKVNRLLRTLGLRAGDDVILTFAATGSPPLDGRRVAEARRALATGPARVRVVGPLGFSPLEGDRPDIVLVQAVRYDSVTVRCQGSGRTNENPSLLAETPISGCDNAVNLATMAAEKRDLTAPRVLRGSDAVPSAAAVARYRVGDVTIDPLDTN